ncbi:MAG: CopG-like DNA-binding protein [Candidatus Angelobacter sp.]|jgi:predicted DNA-binding protein|nr:CopG-like DNA-binding protein [Candidatus Angelobacter sp.]
MLAVRLDSKLEQQLEELAKVKGSTKSTLVRQAVERLLEDEEDTALAEMATKRLRSSKSLTKLRKELGLDR